MGGQCPLSTSADGTHAWEFDGDDPYIVCYFCGERRDAISGRVISTDKGWPMNCCQDPEHCPVAGSWCSAAFHPNSPSQREIEAARLGCTPTPEEPK